MKILILGAQARYERYMPHLPFIRQQELVFMDKESSEAQILAAAADADILFVDAITPVSGTLMAQMPGLKLVHSEGVAYDKIDLAAARARGIDVCNNRGCNAGAVAEQAVLLMLMLMRQELEGDRAVREGRQMEMKERCMREGLRELSECRVGLIGFGDIAKATAQRLAPFGCEVFYNSRHRRSRDEEEIQSVLAGSVWLRDDFGYVQSTMDTLANTYYASSYRGEMGSAEINSAIQAWLNEQTRGLLEEQAANIETNPLTVLLLATTIYYSAQWTDEFNEAANYTDVFHAPSGDTEAEYMRAERGMDYFSGDGWGAVRLPLRGGNGMWFILPDEGVAVDELLQSEEVLGLMASGPNELAGKYAVVHLSVPKFDIAAQLDLIGGLMVLGVTDVFDPDVSDFTPMTTDTDMPIYVSEATHAARVKIDEEGVEAAAFTVIIADGAAAEPEDEIYFTLDRPFLFAISSRDGLPLFTGVVNRPD